MKLATAIGSVLVLAALVFAVGVSPSVQHPNPLLYISSSSSSTLSGVSLDDGDLASFDMVTKTATIVFDEDLFRHSNGNLGANEKIDAVHILPTGNLLLSTEGDGYLGANLLDFEDADIVQYNSSTDSAWFYFIGDNAFRKNSGDLGDNADIDAFYIMDNGHILLSTAGTERLGSPMVEFEDGDLVQYDPVNDVATIYMHEDSTFRKSNGDLGSNEDISGVYITSDGFILLSIKGDGFIGTSQLSFDDGDIIKYDLNQDTAAIFFEEDEFSGNEDIVAIHGNGIGSSDADGDGIADASDAYPNDSTRAFNNYYPSQSSFGTLAFEDLWPAKGDYDFNDMVVDYNFNQVTNASNQVVEIKGKFVLKATGAAYENGFGFQLPLAPGAVSTVSGIAVPGEYVTLAPNKTEASQDSAVIIVFENSQHQLPSTNAIVNTIKGEAYVTPDTLSIIVSMATPVSASGLSAPYNPFIIINKVRGTEVHLPDREPTDLMNTALFGTQDDDSNPASGRYYRTSTNLPFVIDVGASWDYPVEGEQIIHAHLKFEDWTESSGGSFSDWYQNNSGYRNSNKIYSTPQ